MIESIGKALQLLGPDISEAELVVQTSSADFSRYEQTFAKYPHVRLCEMRSFEHLKTSIQEADVLVHVDSFDAAVRRFLRLSASTKIPLCMASGKPILAYGPGELASLRYIQDCQCGVVVGVQDMTLLQEALQSLIQKPQLRSELGYRGWMMARDNHSGSVVRERFRAVLAKACVDGRRRD